MIPRTKVASLLSRRKFVIGTGAAAVAGGALVMPARAQEITGSPVSGTPVAGQPSKDATAEQLAIAVAQGKAYGEALSSVQETVSSTEQWIGDYQVIVLAKSATGMWMKGDDGLEWQAPEKENAHVEVTVRDAADGRFIPNLSIEVGLTAPDGTELDAEETPLVWHPFFYHYGRNWELPGDGDYTVRVKISAPDFGRHDQVNGQRYADDVEFDVTLPITTGQA